MAVSAASSEGDWGLLLEKSSNDQWQEIVILSTGFAHLREADSFIASLLNNDDKRADEKYKSELLAILCFETAVEISPSIRKRVKERVASIIPPKKAAELKSLAAAGDLAVPFLGYKPSYSTKEATACVQALRMISTQASLFEASNYLKDDRGKVTSEVYKFLDLVTPEEVASSGASINLLEFLEKSTISKSIYINGITLDSLSNIPISQISQYLQSDTERLYLDYSDYPYSRDLSIASCYPKLKELVIDGEARSLSEITSIKDLKILDIRNFHNAEWITFEDIFLLKNLEAMKLCSLDEWPFFGELKNFPNLKKLSLMVAGNSEIDYPEIEYISTLDTLEYIHIAIVGSQKGWPDLASLGNLRSLNVLEISTTNDIYNIVGLDGLNDLKKLRKVIVNLAEGRSISEDLISQLKVFCSSSTFELNMKWNSDNW